MPGRSGGHAEVQQHEDRPARRELREHRLGLRGQRVGQPTEAAAGRQHLDLEAPAQAGHVDPFDRRRVVGADAAVLEQREQARWPAVVLQLGMESDVHELDRVRATGDRQIQSGVPGAADRQQECRRQAEPQVEFQPSLKAS